MLNTYFYDNATLRMIDHTHDSILIVDDELMILNALERLFRRYKFRIFVAQSGEEGLKVLQNEQIAVVISDMTMPEMDGATFLKKVADSWPETIRISLTGHSDMQGTIDVVNNAGIFRYISKPWDDNELIENIEHAFSIFHTQEHKNLAQEKTRKKNQELTHINVELKQEVLSKSCKLEKTSDQLASAYEGERKLRLARMEAEKLNEAKSRFLAHMSHEMRSPLNAILAMNKLLLDTDLTEDQRELGRLAYEGGQTLLSLINDILDVSKIEANKLALNAQWFNFKESLENISELMASQTINKPVEVATVISPGTPCELYGDEARIKQILINIVSNAIKFTEKGGVFIKVSPYQEGIQIQVKDTGIGIPTDQKNHIFDEFFQADNSDTRNYGGTGLGLSICKKLLHMMGGDISATSEVGVGSCFQVYLPIKSKSPIEISRSCSKKHLVYIDTSNEILFNATREQLSFFNCDVVSDLNIPPNLDGYDKFTLIKDIKDRNLSAADVKNAFCASIQDKSDLCKTKRIEIIGLIPNDSIGEIDRLKAKGYSTVLRKPIRIDQLKDAVIGQAHEEPHSRKQAPVLRSSDRSNTEGDSLQHDIHILLAEDSPANQAVVKAILKDRYPHIDIASNGKEAVDRARKTPYDVILMDLSMPIMDGIHATKDIRKVSGPNQNTTIIAMTANAFSEDRQRCFASGMNDFVSKPIDVTSFLSCLEYWAGEAQKRGLRHSNRNKNLQPADAEPKLEDEIVDKTTLQQLEKDTSATALPKILEIFYEETLVRIPKMLGFFNSQNWQGLQDEAHILKSSAGSFGAKALFEKAKNMEVALKNQNIERVNSEMDDLNYLATTSIDMIKHYCQQRSAEQ